MRSVILAGGCFWGVEAYFKQLKGVTDTSVGYVDGNKRNTTYEEVCVGLASHAEACEVVYDESVITLEQLLEHYLRFVNPFSMNRQGNDFGRQYRSGIYVNDKADIERVNAYFKAYFKNDYDRVRVVVKMNTDYDLAEPNHQDYLDKNPHGYCHVNLNLATKDEKKDA